MRRPFSIYCDWAYHDELGDAIELDEALTMTALETLARWKAEHGVTFDYYLLDAFWFDPSKPYTAFKPTHWPQGFDRALDEICRLEMIPGLWYDVSGRVLKVPEWAESYDESRRAHSLAYGPFGPSLEAGWRYALETWGVRLFKLDFANFHANPPAWGVPSEEAYRANAAALRDILGRLRREYPDLAVIAYNGIELWPGHLSRAMGAPSQMGFDPSWLEVFDYVYSGDPRPSDLPRTDLRRSMDAFQDHQVWLLAREGFPMERIDDHGCMVGGTNTIFYQKAHGVRRTFLASLAHGGRRALYYGDPTLPTESDVTFMARSRELFFDAFSRGLGTACVGGEPGVAPWYGFLTGGGARGLLYLVNGSTTPQVVELPLPGLSEAHCLFADAGVPVAVAVEPHRLVVELAPEQLALVGLGLYARPELELGLADDAPLPRTQRLLPVTFRPAAGDGLVGTWSGTLEAGEQLLVTAQALANQQSGAWGTEGIGLPVRFGQQMTTTRPSVMRPESHDRVTIRVRAGETELTPVKQVPNVPVWAGISWVSRIYDVPAGEELTTEVAQSLEPRRDLKVRVWALRWA